MSLFQAPFIQFNLLNNNRNPIDIMKLARKSLYNHKRIAVICISIDRGLAFQNKTRIRNLEKKGTF